MLRRTLTILSLIGLLLSVGLWGVSYWNFVCWPSGDLGSFVEISSGGIGYGVRSISTTPIPLGLARNLATMKGRKIDKFREAYSDPPWKWQIGDRTGFLGYAGLDTLWLPRYFASKGMIRLMIPFWVLALFSTASLWLLAVPSMRRRKRKKLGLCLKCGYDLRASKERCPECGESILR